MKRHALLSSIIAVAALLGVGVAQGEETVPMCTEAELDRLLTELERELGDTASMGVRFTQIKHLALFSRPVKSEGRLLYRNPNDIRFELTSPFRSVLIVRGKKVAKHEHIDGKWIATKPPARDLLAAVTGQLASWLRGRFCEQESVYVITATNEPSPTVFLTPRKEQVKRHLAKIEMKVARDPMRIVSLTVHETEEDFTVITFHDEERGRSYPDAWFDVKGPELGDTPMLDCERE